MKFYGGGSVSWAKKDRARAKREGKYLVVLGFNGQDAGIDGAIISMGLADATFVKKIRALILEHSDKNTLERSE